MSLSRGVMNLLTSSESYFMLRISLRVMIPQRLYIKSCESSCLFKGDFIGSSSDTSNSSSSQTRKVWNVNCSERTFNCFLVVCLGIIIGSNNTCACALFTFPTYLACSSIVMNRWIIPRPPFLAISLAILNSVTVSIGELTIGMLSGIFRENFETTEHWLLLVMSLY